MIYYSFIYIFGDTMTKHNKKIYNCLRLICRRCIYNISNAHIYNTLSNQEVEMVSEIKVKYFKRILSFNSNLKNIIDHALLNFQPSLKLRGIRTGELR